MPDQSNTAVAFQGELGAFSHSAALKLIGETAKLVPCPSFKSVFDALRTDVVVAAVIPIENTLHGSIHENYDHLLEYDFVISGETSIRISHQLIAMRGVEFDDINSVLSHPVALSQCKQFFEEHQTLQAVPYYDTAGSVKHLKERSLRGSAAIASETAATIYDGVILRRDIEDNRQNYTRFFLLTKQVSASTNTRQADKTSLVFSTANRPGALFKAMACFALRDLNLTKIESRPLVGRPWEYLFYVDFLGSIHEETAQKAIADLRECTQFVKLLGSYSPTP